MSRRTDYSEILKTKTDHELYQLAKKFLGQSFSGTVHNRWRLEPILDECHCRNPEIYRSALNDAMLEIVKIDKLINEDGIYDVLRTLLMTDEEFNIQFGQIAEPFPDLSGLTGISKENLMFCRVSGDSMINANIRSGDLLVVDRGRLAVSGEIIVASVNSHTFVKRYIINNGKKLLVSENDEYEPVEITPDINFNLIGVVEMIIHKLDTHRHEIQKQYRI